MSLPSSASSFEGQVRILYLADIRFPLDRANGIQTMETCYGLAERGHAVRLVVRPDTATPARNPFEFYGLAPEARLAVVRVPVAGSEPARRLAYLARVCAEVIRSRRHTDVVITRDLGAASFLLRLPASMRPPMVYESHGFSPVYAETVSELLSGAAAASARKRKRLLAREERVWRHASGYVTITRGLMEELTGRFGARENVAVVPDGVRLAPGRQFDPPGPSPTPIVVYAGHLYPWKGVDVLLRALALLPRARGVIVGGHPAEGDFLRLQALAATLGIQDRVRFVGFVHRTKVAGFLQQADVLAMPHTATPVSERYASPLKLFEYMASGRPIVASNVSSTREVLRDGENACLVSPGSPEALAAGITRVFEDRILATRMARTAFDEAPSYTWARRAERLEALLETVVRHP